MKKNSLKSLPIVEVFKKAYRSHGDMLTLQREFNEVVNQAIFDLEAKLDRLAMLIHEECNEGERVDEVNDWLFGPPTDRPTGPAGDCRGRGDR